MYIHNKNFHCRHDFKNWVFLQVPGFKEKVKGLTDKKRTDIEEAYDILEKFLSKTKYLASNTITLADIACFTTVGALVYIVPFNSAK